MLRVTFHDDVVLLVERRQELVKELHPQVQALQDPSNVRVCVCGSCACEWVGVELGGWVGDLYLVYAIQLFIGENLFPASLTLPVKTLRGGGS